MMYLDLTDEKKYAYILKYLLRQYNQVTMLPIAENLSVYIVSSFEIRQYSCIPRLHKRKNFLAMGQRFCKKTVLLSGAASDRRILSYCERRATKPMITQVSLKNYCTLIALSTDSV